MEIEKSGLDRFQRITSIATLNPVFCKENETILSATNKIISSEHEKLPVVDGKNKIVGLISFMDILDAFLRKINLNSQVSTIMVRDLVFCETTDTLEFVLQKIKMARKGMLPMIANKKLAGVVSESDFVKYFDNINFGIKVGELMTRKPFFISPEITVLDALRRAVNVRYRRLPVVQNKKILGLFATFDVLQPIKNNFNLFQPITSIMVKKVLTVKKDEDVSDAIRVMKSNRIDGLPVIDDENNLEGMITERDILEEIV
jgi:predicted transcriptional regulator